MPFYNSRTPLKHYYIPNPEYLTTLKNIFLKCYKQFNILEKEISSIELNDHTNIDNLTDVNKNNKSSKTPINLLSSKFIKLQNFLIENLNKIREIVYLENKKKYLVKIPVEILEHLSKSDDISKTFLDIKKNEITEINEEKEMNIKFQEIINKLETMNFF